MEPLRILRRLLLMFAVAGVNFAGAQQDGVISADRPDNTQGTSTLHKRNFQIENGVTFGSEDLMNNLMLRYGITDKTEIRLLVDAGKQEGVRGIMPVTLGLKQKLAKQKGVLPAVAFVGSLMIQPLATRDFSDTGVDFMLRLAFENELTDQLSLDYNIATAELFKELQLTTELSYNPGGKWAGFVEYFSTISAQQPEHNLDAGLKYLVNSNLQLDIAGGRSIFDSEPRIFGTVGVAYLIRAKKSKQ